MSKSAKSGIERRKAKRRPVISTFSLFVVVPKKGIHRLNINDLSEEGIGFELDTEGEDPGEFPIKQGDSLDVRFYLNQSLYLPLTVKIMRLFEGTGGIRKVGASFADLKSPGYQALSSF